MRLEDGRKAYNSIEIPSELHDVVTQAIASKDKMKIKRRRKNHHRSKGHILRNVAMAAAALFICFTIGLNTNEVFAKEMSEVPMLGTLAKVLTIRSYHGVEGDYEINLEVPEIQNDVIMNDMEENIETGEESAKNPAFTGDINSEIQKIVDEYMKQAKEDFEEYKEAFFATGGTEEEWADRKMDITVDYDVKYQQGNILSMELLTAKGWVAYNEERHYYNLNLQTGEYLSLQKLLGEDYINLCNESIDRQIKERIASDDSLAYFGYGTMAETDKEMQIEGFKTITSDTEFYINKAGNVVIVFPKYEIAPGYMGMQEFEIEKAKLP